MTKQYNAIITLILKMYFRFFPTGITYFGHGVTLKKHDAYIDHLHDNANELESLIVYWKKLGFKFISHEELLKISQNNFQYNFPWIHFTFDDGYSNNLYTLLPLIEKHNVPVSIFISTAHIEHQQRFNTYIIRTALLHTRKEYIFKELNISINPKASRQEKKDIILKISAYYKTLSPKDGSAFIVEIETLLHPEEWTHYNKLYRDHKPLNIDELKELAKHPLVYIGSHNHYHTILNKNASENDIRYEMQTSHNWLKENIGIETETYAYPNGSPTDFSELTKKTCHETGYKLAYTTIPEFVNKKTQPLEIPRMFLQPKAGRRLTRKMIKQNPILRLLKGKKSIKPQEY